MAEERDRASVGELILASARQLSRGYYSADQIEAAITHVFGVDSALLQDGTYFVAVRRERLCGGGGWSKRRTLFGGDQFSSRDRGDLEPRRDAAKIRAFFVHPDFVRRGIGRMLLQRSEEEAHRAGFRKLELMSTLPGVAFYLASGYRMGKPVVQPINRTTTIEFVPMTKDLPELAPGVSSEDAGKPRRSLSGG